MACATVLGITITSIFPPVNGLDDHSAQVLSTRFQPYSEKVSKTSVTIMWTSLNYPKVPQQTWLPNHFVPVFKKKNTPTLIDLTNCNARKELQVQIIL